MKGVVYKDWQTKVKQYISFPLIFGAVIPLMLLDLWIELYHRICFPLYGIPLVNRSSYIIIDRHKLSYLNISRKVSCVYCGYANGLMQYWVKITGDTEEYRCGIQHAGEDKHLLQAHHAGFARYGDEEDMKRKYFGGLE